MSPLSTQLANNLSHEEIVNEIEVRGIKNIPDETILSLLKRVGALVEEGRMELSDLDSSIDSLQDDYDDLERRHDDLEGDLVDLRSRFDDNAVEIEEFIEYGRLDVESIETGDDGDASVITMIPIHENGGKIEGNVSIRCARPCDSVKMSVTLLVNNEEHTTLDGAFENDIDTIQQSIMPYLVYFLYKNLNDRRLDSAGR